MNLVPPRRGWILFSAYPPFSASLTLAFQGGLNNFAPAALGECPFETKSHSRGRLCHTIFFRQMGPHGG